jgi:hypothetical protein
MDPYQTAWKSFLETGKIDDYMTYCAKRKEEMKQTDAANNERNCPAGQKDGR